MSCNNCKPDWKCNQGRCTIMVDRMSAAKPGDVVPLPAGLTLDEWLQRRMPSDGTGFFVASCIVFGIAVGVLLAHAWARMV